MRRMVVGWMVLVMVVTGEAVTVTATIASVVSMRDVVESIGEGSSDVVSTAELNVDVDKPGTNAPLPPGPAPAQTANRAGVWARMSKTALGSKLGRFTQQSGLRLKHIKRLQELAKRARVMNDSLLGHNSYSIKDIIMLLIQFMCMAVAYVSLIISASTKGGDFYGPFSALLLVLGSITLTRLDNEMTMHAVFLGIMVYYFPYSVVRSIAYSPWNARRAKSEEVDNTHDANILFLGTSLSLAAVCVAAGVGNFAKLLQTPPKSVSNPSNKRTAIKILTVLSVGLIVASAALVVWDRTDSGVTTEDNQLNQISAAFLIAFASVIGLLRGNKAVITCSIMALGTITFHTFQSLFLISGLNSRNSLAVVFLAVGTGVLFTTLILDSFMTKHKLIKGVEGLSLGNSVET